MSQSKPKKGKTVHDEVKKIVRDMLKDETVCAVVGFVRKKDVQFEENGNIAGGRMRMYAVTGNNDLGIKVAQETTNYAYRQFLLQEVTEEIINETQETRIPPNVLNNKPIKD